jgi:hypothetical protein
MASNTLPGSAGPVKEELGSEGGVEDLRPIGICPDAVRPGAPRVAPPRRP